MFVSRSNLPRAILAVSLSTSLAPALAQAGPAANWESAIQANPVAPMNSSTHPAPPLDKIGRFAGIDPASHIEYLRLMLNGSVRNATGESPSSHVYPPVLIAQCTQRPDGKYRFELLSSFGEATDLKFYPPWVPASSQDLFPPRTVKVTITMEFFGYTHVKPIRRQWKIPAETPGLYRYNTPGGGSPNMEEVAYYLRYLLALPTLRLSQGAQTADFATSPWISAIRKEPLCRAAGL